MNIRETVIERERRIMQAITDRNHGINTPDVYFKNHVADARLPDSSGRYTRPKKDA
jgi:hypothetical protein